MDRHTTATTAITVSARSNDSKSISIPSKSSASPSRPLVPSQVRSRLIAAVASSISFSLCLIAIVYCIAALANGSARSWMAVWEDNGRLSNLAEWHAARDRLRFAVRLTPLNADYAADLGRLMEWAAWRHGPDDERGIQFRRAAVVQYSKVALRRPSWGYGWAHLAESRLLGEGADAGFRHALLKAIELAPWEPQVQRKVAWLGMAAWGELPPDLRDLVRHNVSRAVSLDVHRDEIIRLAFQYEWLDQLRPMLKNERQRAAYEFVAAQMRKR